MKRLEQNGIDKSNDEYIALYRKWRPNGFESLIGQDHIKKALTNALESGRIAHAYLFTGPRGTGKTSTARILAKALNCEQGPTANPCNVCANCIAADKGSSMDIFEIDAASNRGIDEIRQLRERVAFTPVNSRYSVYIIDEVHMISVDAFNALLKTLEEPPAHVVFILATTEPQKIPATIHSRCQRFDFRRVTVEAISKHLKYVAKESKIKIDDEAAKIIALQADGGMRDALSLLDQCFIMNGTVTAEVVRNVLGIVGREELRKLVKAIGNNDLGLALQKLNELTLNGKDLNQIIVEVAEYLRAILLYKVTPDYEEIYLTDTKEAIAELEPLYSKDRLIAAEQRLHVAGQELKQTVNGRINVELCFFDLCRVKGNTIEALTARIEALEEKINSGDFVSSTKVRALANENINVDVSSNIETFRNNIKRLEEKNINADEKNSLNSSKMISTNDDTNDDTNVDINVDTFEQSREDITNEASNALKVKNQETENIIAKDLKLNNITQDNTVNKNKNIKAEDNFAEFDIDKHVPIFEKLNIDEAEIAEVVVNSEDNNIETGDLVMARKIWKALIAEIKNMRKRATAACCENGEPSAYNGSTMVVSFKSKTFSTRMNKADYKKIVEEAIQRAIGKPINMQFVLKKNESAKLKETTAVKKTPKKSIDRMEKLKAMKMEECNCAQKALKVFGGTLKKI